MIALSLLGGCGEKKQASVEAAETLAEALYPGRLEILDTRWRLKEDGGHDVILGIKGDPVTRIRFAVDKEPGACVSGSLCEAKLRAAFEDGVARAGELRAIERGFRACGVPALAVEALNLQQPHRQSQSLAARVTLAMNLDTASRAAAQERLAACVADWGRERRGLPWSDRPAYFTALIIPEERPGEFSPPALLTFETRAPSGRDVLYAHPFRLEGETVTPLSLRFSPPSARRREFEKIISERAAVFLAAQPGFGTAQVRDGLHRPTLDPVRTDVIRTYALACSRKADTPVCRVDVAVRLRFDLTTGETSDLELVRDIRDARNVVALPFLPGEP